MADLKWIQRVVDTAGRPCPLMKMKCPGTRQKCAFWVDEVLKNAATGADDLQSGCLMAWQYVIGHEIMLESVRTQAGMDKVATAAVESGAVVARTLVQLAVGRAPAQLP